MAYQILRVCRPAYGGGSIEQFYAVEDGGPIPCSRLAATFFEKHINLRSRQRERAWCVIKQAISDILTPSIGLSTTQADQESALAWLLSESGENVLEIVGLDAEFARGVIARLSTATEDL